MIPRRRLIPSLVDSGDSPAVREHFPQSGTFSSAVNRPSLRGCAAVPDSRLSGAAIYSRADRAVYGLIVGALVGCAFFTWLEIFA